MDEKREDMDSLEKLRDMIYEIVEEMDEAELKALLELARILISDDVPDDVDDGQGDVPDIMDEFEKSGGKDRVLWKQILWSEKIKKIRD